MNIGSVAERFIRGFAPGVQFRNPWSWYAVAASQDLSPGKIMQVVLNEEDLILWRSHQERKPCAWSDRCPHRGMRLSFGATFGETLVCPYHGWNFDTDGHCHHIPAHPTLSPTPAARARTYPIAEQSGYLWVCLGEPSSSQPQTIDKMCPLRTLHFPVDIDVTIAVLLVCPLEHTLFRREAFLCLDDDDVEWMSDGGGEVVIRTKLDRERNRDFTAHFALPSQVSCELPAQAGQPARYCVLVQPTKIGACAVHLAVETRAAAELKLALNRSLVALRHDVERLARAPAVARVLRTFAGMARDHVSV